MQEATLRLLIGPAVGGAHTTDSGADPCRELALRAERRSQFVVISSRACRLSPPKLHKPGILTSVLVNDTARLTFSRSTLPRSFR